MKKKLKKSGKKQKKRTKSGKIEKKTHKKSKNASLFEQKAEKTKKKLQNDSFCCVFFVKVAHRIQKALSVVKLAI